MSENVIYWILLIMSFFVIVSCVMTIILVIHTLKTKKRMEEISRIVYLSMKKESYIETRLTDIENGISNIYKGVGSLSSSTQSVIAELEDHREKNKRKWPTPDIAKMVTYTLQEQLTMEVRLSQHMRIPNNDSIRKVITFAVETYPNVSIAYIVRNAYSLVEQMIMQAQQAQQE